jgi:hypothetical protein
LPIALLEERTKFASFSAPNYFVSPLHDKKEQIGSVKGTLTLCFAEKDLNENWDISVIKLPKGEFFSGDIYNKCFITVAVIFSAVALFEWALTAFCLVMLSLDHRPESNWNSSVSFYGSQALLLTVLTGVIVVIYKSLAKYRG